MSTALSKSIQQQLAARQETMAARLAGLGSGESMPFVKVKNKQFFFPDGSSVKGSLSMVVLDWGYHYAYWEGAYNPGDTDSPVCVAVGQNPATLVPAAASPKRQNDICATCPMNQFGSGNGNRKACKNTVNLAFMRYDDEVEDDTIYFLAVPPASLKNWGMYNKKLMEAGVAEAQVVTVVELDMSVDHIKFKFSAHKAMTSDYQEEDEDGNSYMAAFLSQMPKATEAILREPSFSSDES